MAANLNKENLYCLLELSVNFHCSQLKLFLIWNYEINYCIKNYEDQECIQSKARLLTDRKSSAYILTFRLPWPSGDLELAYDLTLLIDYICKIDVQVTKLAFPLCDLDLAPIHLGTQTWPRYSKDIPPYQKEVSIYMNCFNSYSLNRVADRQTDRQTLRKHYHHRVRGVKISLKSPWLWFQT